MNTVAIPPAAQQRKARGPYIDETALMLAIRDDAEAALRPYVEAAQVDWETYAPQAYRPLLLATVLLASRPTGRRSGVPSIFVWDDAKGQYRLRNRPVTNNELVDAFDFYVQSKVNFATSTPPSRRRNARKRAAETEAAKPTEEAESPEAIFQALRNGTISVKEAQLAGERTITLAHVAALLVAIGGASNLTGASFGIIGDPLTEHLQEWRDRMRFVAEGAPLDGRVRVVLTNLIRAAAASRLVVEGMVMARHGFDECRNILRDGAHHCIPKNGRPSCTSITERRWTPIAQRVERGLRACWWNCRCRWVYRNSTTGEMRY